MPEPGLEPYLLDRASLLALGVPAALIYLLADVRASPPPSVSVGVVATSEFAAVVAAELPTLLWQAFTVRQDPRTGG